MTLRPHTDRQIFDHLWDIAHNDKINVTTLEAEFLEEILFKRGLLKRGDDWTVEQRARAAQIAEKYRHLDRR